MKLDSRSGATLAAAAATLFLAGVCKGQSACKGGNHACKGLNACKGQGFSEMTKDKCAEAKGKFEKS
jgi:hypothetical protein